ncbi:MAG: lipopolysaccharide biosynthesis protein [Micavibrio sp.]
MKAGQVLEVITKKMPFLSVIHPRIYKGVISMFALRGIQMGLGLATMYFLSHTLTQKAFGEYSFIVNAVGLLTIFSLTGLTDSVMQAVARGFQGTYRAATPIAFYSSLIASLILLIMGGWYLSQDHWQLAAGLFAAAFLFPFSNGLLLWKGVTTGSEKFPTLLRLEGANSAIMSVLVIGGVILMPGIILIPLVVGMTIPAIQNIRQTIRSFKEINKVEPVEEGGISYGVKTTFYNSLNIVARHADKLLLFMFLSPQTLALFVASEKLSETIRTVTQDIAAVLGPRFAQYSHYTDRLDKALKVFSMLMGISIIIFAFTVLPWILVTIFGEAYSPAIPYAQALMCSSAIGNLANLQFRFIRSQLDEKAFRKIIIITALSKITSSAILIPFMGITGAVISVFIFRIVMSIIVYNSIKKFRPGYNMRMKDVK